MLWNVVDGELVITTLGWMLIAWAALSVVLQALITAIAANDWDYDAGLIGILVVVGSLVAVIIVTLLIATFPGWFKWIVGFAGFIALMYLATRLGEWINERNR